MKRLLLTLVLASLSVQTAVAQSSYSGGGGSSTSPNLPTYTAPLVTPGAMPIQLIQPLDDQTYSLQSTGGIQIAFDYFNLSWPWLLGTAAGLAVLQGVVGGVQIMYGGSPDKVDEGKTRFTWALGGMLILGLAGLILRILNPTAFV
jgi:hypothetical protein